MFTLRELMDTDIEIQGTLKIQCWENEDCPTVYFNADISEFDYDEAEEYIDKGIKYMFPYMFNITDGLGSHRNRVGTWMGGICIELEKG